MVLILRGDPTNVSLCFRFSTEIFASCRVYYLDILNCERIKPLFILIEPE